MNQLVREDNYLLNKTYIFTYDTSGNILSKKTFNSVLTATTGTPDSTINYTYASTGWKDQLVSFGGETITYDVLGNPTTYRGHTLNWGKLRQLNSFDSNIFTYNAEGIRTSKNNITYTLDGTKILSETRPTGTIKYLYGINGVIGFVYNNTTYYYVKNSLNDVVAIIDVNGTIKAKYNYDAWGNHTITLDTDGIGTLNPIRYRSYYFDTETGLYYLKSRYYDPVACRFINADIYVSTGAGILGNNMYTYCNNNSIMYTDSTGKSIDLTILLLLALGLCLGLTSCGTTAPRPKNQLLANPFEDYPNYASFNDLLKEACQKVYTATAEAGFTKEFGTTIFIIPYDSAYDVDEDRADNYWMSDVYYGTAEKVDHNMARLNEDHVDIFAYIHSHVDNDEREANGGFSGKDCQNIPQNQKHIKQYVITKEGFVYEFNPITGTGGENPIFQCS